MNLNVQSSCHLFYPDNIVFRCGPHSCGRYTRLLDDDLCFTLEFATAVTENSHGCHSSYPHP